MSPRSYLSQIHEAGPEANSDITSLCFQKLQRPKTKAETNAFFLYKIKKIDEKIHCGR